MTQNEIEIVKVLTPYIAIFPDCKLDSKGMELYAVALNDYPAGVIDCAMQSLIKTTKFFPRIADIFEEIERLTECAERKAGRFTLTAHEAFENAQKVIYGHSRYDSSPMVFATPEVEEAARRYGINAFHDLLTSEMGVARAQFGRIYEDIIRRKKEMKKNEKLLGLMDEKVKNFLLGVKTSNMLEN